MARETLDAAQDKVRDVIERIQRSQKAAASLTPKINQLYDAIKLGEADRSKEMSLRWQAGFDLAMPSECGK